MGQGDPSPEKLSGHHWIWDHLFHLWTVLNTPGLGRQTSATRSLPTACLSLTELKGTYINYLPKWEPACLMSPRPQPLAVLIYTMRLAPSLHCFVYKAIICISITLELLHGPREFSGEQSGHSSCRSYLGLNDLGYLTGISCCCSCPLN